MSLGDWLRELRQRSGLGFLELELAAGVNWRTVSLWEKDRTRPHPDLLRAVLEAYVVRIFPDLPRREGLEMLLREQLELGKV